MAWINLSRHRTKSKSFSDTWKVLQLGPTRPPGITAPTAPNPRDTDLPLPLPLPSPFSCPSADPRCPSGSSQRPRELFSPLSIPPTHQHPGSLPLVSLANSPGVGSSSPVPSVRPEPVAPVFSFGPFQPSRCQRRADVAYREPLAENSSARGGGGTCAEGESARALGSGLPASQLQLVPVARDSSTALPPPIEAHSAWPWTWQERLRAAKRQRMDARACGEAAEIYGEAGEAGGAQDWGKLEAEAEGERRRKQRLGILSGMRQMLESPGFAAARGQKRKFVVRQGGFKHRLPKMRGGSSASSSGDQSSEKRGLQERENGASGEAEDCRAAADSAAGATRAAHDAAQLAVGGRAGPFPGVASQAVAPHHAAQRASSVATMRIGGSSTGRNGGRSARGGRGGEYEVESAQCAEEGGGDGEARGNRIGEYRSCWRGSGLDKEQKGHGEGAGVNRESNGAQTAADGADGADGAATRPQLHQHHPSRLGRPPVSSLAAAAAAPPAPAAQPIAPPAFPSRPCSALPFPLLFSALPRHSHPANPSRQLQASLPPYRPNPALAAPHQVRQSRDPGAAGAAAPVAAAAAAAAPQSGGVTTTAAAVAVAASVEFPLWVRQLQECAGGVAAGAAASECTGETPASVLETPQGQSEVEGSGSSAEEDGEESSGGSGGERGGAGGSGGEQGEAGGGA